MCLGIRVSRLWGGPNVPGQTRAMRQARSIEIDRPGASRWLPPRAGGGQLSGGCRVPVAGAMPRLGRHFQAWEPGPERDPRAFAAVSEFGEFGHQQGPRSRDRCGLVVPPDAAGRNVAGKSAAGAANTLCKARPTKGQRQCAGLRKQAILARPAGWRISAFDQHRTAAERLPGLRAERCRAAASAFGAPRSAMR